MYYLKQSAVTYIVLCVAIVFLSVPLQAQKITPVAWNFEAKDMGKRIYEVHLSAVIESGWHIYSQTSAEGGPMPTMIKFNLHPQVRFKGSPKELGDVKEKLEPSFGVLTRSFEKKVTFVQIIELAADTIVFIAGNVQFMACNDEQCLLPETVNFNVQLAHKQTSTIESDADSDWAALQKSLQPIKMSTAEYEAYEKLSGIDSRKSEDDYKRRMMTLANAFWDKYPNDKRRTEAMVIFVSSDPFFITTPTPEYREKLQKLPWQPGQRRQYLRSIPFDTKAMTEWNRKGEEMVASVLASPNASPEEKENAEFLLFARDFRNAFSRFLYLPKEALMEKDYWTLIENDLWLSFRLRFDAHAFKYAELPVIADRARDFLAGLKGFSSSIAEETWKHLFKTTSNIINSNSPLSNKTGIKALHAAADKQLKVLMVEAGDKPVDLKFTAIDGRVVDISALRGKVVLIDFWATWCAPCVAEMPHVKSMYEKYHHLGFEVVGISFDDQQARDKVINVIKKYGINWPQGFEGNNGENYRLLYGITGLPTVWLLDKSGKIVDRNARGEKLETLIRSQLGSQ